MIVGGVVAVLALAALWQADQVEQWLAPDVIQARVEAAGAWGPLVYILLAMASFLVFLLAPVVWVATALWSPPVAFAYSFIAALVASLLTYGMTFALGRDWARARVPESFAQWEARLEARPIAALVAIRFWLWANPFVDMLVAVSRVPTSAYVAGTILGLLWPTAFQVAMGAGGGAILSRLDLPTWAWVVLAAAVAAGVVVVLLRRRQAADA